MHDQASGIQWRVQFPRAEIAIAALDRAWAAMTAAGYPADGNIELSEAITKALDAQRGEINWLRHQLRPI